MGTLVTDICKTMYFLFFRKKQKPKNRLFEGLVLEVGKSNQPKVEGQWLLTHRVKNQTLS